ncbi:MAG: PhzF family phenazine biosynthesis protein [Patescibacteria group bacterium]
MQVTVYLLHSFGVETSGGNPAGVVLDAEQLTDKQKIYIAHEIGYSETAFIEKSDKADFKVSFFTPVEEVPVCGHATIATYSLLFQKKLIKPGSYTHELKPGVLPIEISDDGMVFMDLAVPVFSDVIPVEDLQGIFSVSKEAISSTGLPVQIVSTGNPNIFLPIKDRQTLFDLQVDLEKMAVFNRKTKTIGFYVFTLDTLSKNAIAHARCFWPLYGVNEESVTANAAGSLACYLFNYKKVKNGQANHLLFEQGYSLHNPCAVTASLKIQNNTIQRVQVGGKATIIGEKMITVPDEL